MDLKQLKTIMEMFEKSGLSELTIKMKDEEVCLKKPSSDSQPVAVYQAVHSAAPLQQQQAGLPAGKAVPDPAPSTSKEPVAAAGNDVEIIRAPLVGTFYRAPAPDAPPFVEKGGRVKKGQTLCILEAMKLMNEFQAEFDLSIVNVLVENGKMVEFGTPLFEVRRV